MSDDRKQEGTISFQGKEHCLNVGRDVIRNLGCPLYVALFVSERGNSLAITPCDEKNPISFKVPESFLESDNAQFRIHSKQFVDGVLMSAQKDLDKTYRVKGYYDAEHNAMIFSFEDFMPLAANRIIVI